jgi:ABC-type Mn2+/Zn2+ transport system ATPase subunit
MTLLMNERRTQAKPQPNPPRAGSEPVLELDGVNLGYGPKLIVREINLTLRCGTCMGLLGPNGAGKTTLLRGLLGILKPARGRITWGEVDGEPVCLGYVPQKERLDSSYPLTVTEVVRMGVYSERPWSPWLKTEHRHRVWQALESVGMTSFAKRLFSECSGGQRQRILIARALAARPNLLIFDEPTTGIDPASQREVVKLLEELRATQHLTMLIVTQHFGHVEQLFDEVAWVQDGRVLVGPAKEFLTDEFISKAFGKS